MKTIYALSSGHLPSAVAVVRVSGKKVAEILKTLCGKDLTPRIMHYGQLTAKNGDFLDKTLSLYFKAPHSFTGEDCAEFHLHGGKAVVERFLQELSSFDDCRQAEAGEFSRRAFANGKLDLSQAEGLADLIEAETESQRRLAIMGASGAMAKIYREWRQQLIKARALIEAELDFADEGDVPGSVADMVWKNVKNLSLAIQNHIDNSHRATKMRDGLNIVLVGAPNAGKSSIINYLAGRDVAIVTEEAGTTRDALEVRLNIAGLPILLTDTAGLRETNNKIEKMGIATAEMRIKEADLVLLISDMQKREHVNIPDTKAEIWHIGNKSDIKLGDKNLWPIQFSAKTGAGMAEFLQNLQDFCQKFNTKIGNMVSARQRQIDLLNNALIEMQQALNGQHLDLTLRAEHLRLAANDLGKITGDMDVEDILDVIFSEFCIGK